jgi:xanthine dehydrogenase YagS FAD-binding subunit
VAHKPWRDLDAEALLVGRMPGPAAYAEVARCVVRAARSWGGQDTPESLPGNRFKIPLAERAIVRALEMAHAGMLTNTGEDALRNRQS